MPDITVVHAPACHFCDDARAALAGLGREYPLRVEFLDAASAAGAELVRAHRAPMFPLVVVDGEFFSHGRLPVRKLRALLEARRVVGTR